MRPTSAGILELGVQESGPRLRPTDLAALPRRVTCPTIYGGAAVAVVRRTLQGAAVLTRFTLANDCEIKSWKRNRALLESPSAGAPG